MQANYDLVTNFRLPHLSTFMHAFNTLLNNEKSSISTGISQRMISYEDSNNRIGKYWGIAQNKIVVDATNTYSENLELIDLGNRTSSEEVAKAREELPGAHIVKAFNTMYYETLRTESRISKDDRLVLFVAGDDADAKSVVSKLIEYIGFTPVDTGSLGEGGRKQQPGSPIYDNPMTVEVAHKRLSEIA